MRYCTAALQSVKAHLSVGSYFVLYQYAITVVCSTA